MAEVKIKYGTRTALTLSLASLATSSTFVAGQESNEVNNDNSGANLYDDVLVQGKVRVGTSPTANTQIRIYVWGSDQSLGSAGIDVLDGTDSAETFTSAGVRNGAVKLAAILDVDATTSARDYFAAPFSIADLFGGAMPRFWGLFVTHNTGVNLDSTAGNHVFAYTPITYTVA